MKQKPASVVSAEIARDLKLKELEGARESVKRLEREWIESAAAVRDAQTLADASLPQCEMVYRKWPSGREESAGRVVIIKRTPTGILVTRRIGDTARGEHRFKWAEYSGRYVQAEKATWASDRRELRDVPAEYTPEHAREGSIVAEGDGDEGSTPKGPEPGPLADAPNQ